MASLNDKDSSYLFIALDSSASTIRYKTRQDMTIQHNKTRPDKDKDKCEIDKRKRTLSFDHFLLSLTKSKMIWIQRQRQRYRQRQMDKNAQRPQKTK
jgi:hypothetical protein